MFETPEDRLTEVQLYGLVAEEIENNQQSKGLWAKAISDSEGNHEKAKALYIKLRVQMIKDEWVYADKVAAKEAKRVGEAPGWPKKIAEGELDQWINEQLRSKNYHRRDLKRLKKELGNDAGNPELWSRAVREAKEKDKNPDFVYRLYRLQQLEEERKQLGKKLGRYFWIFLLASMAGFALGGTVSSVFGVVGGVCGYVWAYFGIRWLYHKF